MFDSMDGVIVTNPTVTLCNHVQPSLRHNSVHGSLHTAINGEQCHTTIQKADSDREDSVPSTGCSMQCFAACSALTMDHVEKVRC